jgi:predicted dehydrogenase
MDTVRWGIIGAGDVCERKSGPAFYKIGHSALSAIMRRNEAKAKDFAHRHHVPRYYTNVEEFMAGPEVDAVYVATPPNTHAEYAIMAMKSGKPVYVEKPMAMNYAECLRMIKVSEETGQKLFTAFYRRGLPYFLKVKSLLDEQAIGQALCVSMKHYKTPAATDLDPALHTWRIDPKVAGDGYFYDLAPHTLDILGFLLGEIDDAKGYACNLGHLYQGVNDTISATLHFKLGVTGTAQWCFVASEDAVEDSIEIIGEKGKICFSTFAFSPIRLIRQGQTETFAILPPEHIQQPLIQTIVDELRGVGKCPSTGINGAATAWVMDRILSEDGLLPDK